MHIRPARGTTQDKENGNESQRPFTVLVIARKAENGVDFISADVRGPEVQSRKIYLTFVLGGDKVEKSQKSQMCDEHLQAISEEVGRQAVLQRLPVLGFAMAIIFRNLKTTADE